MGWNDLLKDINVRFKHRNWLLIDQPIDGLLLNEAIMNSASDYLQATLILDCDLEDILQIVRSLGIGVSYAASLQTVGVLRNV